MSKTGSTTPLAIVVLVLGAFVLPQTSRAQVTATPGGPQPAGQIQSLLTEMEDTLRGIELDLNRIESTGLIDQRSLEIEGMFEQFGEATQDAYQVASDAVMRDISPPGAPIGVREQRESVVLMEELENVLLGHRRRVEAIIPRMAEIDAKVRTGDIVLSEEILRSLGRDELNVFRSTLSPKAERFYRARLPQLFSGPVGSVPDDVAQQQADYYAKVAQYLQINYPSLLQRFANVLLPPAHAAIAVGCLPICKASVGTACLLCVSAASQAAAALIPVYRSCSSSCGSCKWYRPWACACKGFCLIGFLAGVG